MTDPDTAASAITYRANGPLPAGLTLSAAGVLAGTPTGPSDGQIRVLVQNRRNAHAPRAEPAERGGAIAVHVHNVGVLRP